MTRRLSNTQQVGVKKVEPSASPKMDGKPQESNTIPQGRLFEAVNFDEEAKYIANVRKKTEEIDALLKRLRGFPQVGSSVQKNEIGVQQKVDLEEPPVKASKHDKELRDLEKSFEDLTSEWDATKTGLDQSKERRKKTTQESFFGGKNKIKTTAVVEKSLEEQLEDAKKAKDDADKRYKAAVAALKNDKSSKAKKDAATKQKELAAAVKTLTEVTKKMSTADAQEYKTKTAADARAKAEEERASRQSLTTKGRGF